MITQLPLDYSRCGNKDCPCQETCARFRDIPIYAPWLSMTIFEDENCEMFIEYLLDKV